MSDTLIKIENLHRYYADTHAVKGISFELHQGQVLGFLGPNGAGKSTSMQMISGVLAPSAGRILINGIDLLDNPREAKNQTGYLPEKPPVYPELTVDEYLTYSARLRNIHKSKLTNAVDDAKQRCGLTQVGRRLIGNLSKGYQQRVGIAQAIIHNPAVVILDEPTVGLDPIQIREIRQLIADLGKQHGVILSTHILPEVQAVCSHVQIINQGQLVFSDSMESMNQQLQCNQLIVAFIRPPEEKFLLELKGINHLDDLQNGRFRLHVENDHSTAELIVSTSAEQNWGLIELTPEKQTLEQIFVELTSSDLSKENAA
ncbi:MAG: ABC transporter ATP-binding protein [Gammaproteobacteria bacterium]|nr:ABC transporter ATP-binding protein [Gammaproteobacteria bacterium]MCW8910035.1 ABC transporter ATP-binding protein [Gammaproteobacteria bacterium]MCW9005324.1 ABC transporter ATP-binding protein [Gammaproteobacteria bacterium]MCW9057001.1 ABC transporter ATP-binding protein [Gammaproteobacteria bacterium]